MRGPPVLRPSPEHAPSGIFPLSQLRISWQIPTAMRTSAPVLILAALTLSACHSSDEKRPASAPPSPITGSVLTLATTDLPVHEQVVGTVNPKLQATISAKVTGRLLDMQATPGKSVQQGQLLATIETPQLASALERAEAALTNALSESKRFEAARGSVSERDIDRAAATLRMATADRNRLQSQLDDATVRAPFTGRITRKNLDTGDLVQPGTAICQIEDPSSLRLDIHVAESLASGIQLEQRIAVRIASAGLDIEGIVSEISPAADRASRTFMVKLDLPGSDRLLAGQFGRALLPRDTKTALVVPPAALLSRGQLTYAAVLGDQDLAALRIVRTGPTRPEGTEILAGLNAGERILAEIPADFSSGTPVTPH